MLREPEFEKSQVVNATACQQKEDMDSLRQMLQKEVQFLKLLRGIPGVPEIIQSPSCNSYIVSTLLHATLDMLGRRLRSDSLPADVFLVARQAGAAITVSESISDQSLSACAE